MSYILVIWTVVAMVHGYNTKYDWRPIGEFSERTSSMGGDALKLCQDAARELNLDPKNYRCVRSK